MAAVSYTEAAAFLLWRFAVASYFYYHLTTIDTMRNYDWATFILLALLLVSFGFLLTIGAVALVWNGLIAGAFSVSTITFSQAAAVALALLIVSFIIG